MISNHRGPRPRAIPAAAAVLALAVAAASCGGDGAPTRDRTETAPGPAAEQGPTELRDRTFVSTAVSEGGEPQALFVETPIEVSFEKRDDHDVIGWKARCNVAGGRVAISADRLVLGRAESTAIGCPGEREEQDAWLRRFFDSNPRWSMSDDRLALTSGAAAIELEARRR